MCWWHDFIDPHGRHGGTPEQVADMILRGARPVGRPDGGRAHRVPGTPPGGAGARRLAGRGAPGPSGRRGGHGRRRAPEGLGEGGRAWRPTRATASSTSATTRARGPDHRPAPRHQLRRRRLAQRHRRHRAGIPLHRRGPARLRRESQAHGHRLHRGRPRGGARRDARGPAAGPAVPARRLLAGRRHRHPLRVHVPAEAAAPVPALGAVLPAARGVRAKWASRPSTCRSSSSRTSGSSSPARRSGTRSCTRS